MSDTLDARSVPSDPTDLKAWLGFAFSGRLGRLALSSLLINAGILVPSLFGMLVYDKVAHNGIFETLWALVAGVLLYLGMEMTLRSIRMRDTERVAAILDESIDDHLFSSLLRASSRSGGQPGMAARFLTLYRDLAAARDFFSSQYLLAMADLPFLIVVLLAIGMIAWPLLMVVLVWLTVYLVAGHILKLKSQNHLRQSNELQATKLALLSDTLSSLDTLRTSHAGERMRQRFAQLSREHARVASTLRMSTLVQSHWQMAIYLLSYVSLMVTGAYLIFGQFITVGALMAVSMLNGRTLGTIGQVLMALGRWKELQQSMKQLEPFMQPVAEQSRPPSPGAHPSFQDGMSTEPMNPIHRPRGTVRGHLAFENLSHRFASGQMALRDLSLQIRPGERIGLLGRPGSGKSTLLRILSGAILPSEGSVRVDHISLHGLDPGDRVRWLSFKPQESPLIAGTLESNILMNLQDQAGAQERLQALDHALYVSTLDQDLASGTLHLDQMVEEYGANLSGGQRQKVALARALAIRPQLLLLDEPTAGLDTETEQAMIARLGALQDITLIMVTHSAVALGITDRLVVLEQGRLLADGPTRQLLVHKPSSC